MSSVEFRTLQDKDFPEWVRFHDQLYGPNYVLTDKTFLDWYLKRKGYFDTVLALDRKRIVGTYCALTAPLRVKNKVYEMCWFVSGIVHPDYRGGGIGQTFVKMLLDKFDVCGVIGFNAGVRKNYVRAGFKQFEEKTLRRFALILNPQAYSLVQEKSRVEIESLLEVNEEPKNFPIVRERFETVTRFTDETTSHFLSMTTKLRVNSARNAEYLNWRYFSNPYIRYDVTSNFGAYVVSRHECFYPTSLFATRIIDLAGFPSYASSLILHEIQKAIARHDAFMDFSCTGHVFDEVLGHHGFTELLGESYGALPLVSCPLEYRENEEYICLGSRKLPHLFDDIEYDDLYFTRGDSDRDRYNGRCRS